MRLNVRLDDDNIFIRTLHTESETSFQSRSIITSVAILRTFFTFNDDMLENGTIREWLTEGGSGSVERDPDHVV